MGTTPPCSNRIPASVRFGLPRPDNITRPSNISTRIGTQLHFSYVLNYEPRNGVPARKWRKVKGKLVPFTGLPRLTEHARYGPYATLQ